MPTMTRSSTRKNGKIETNPSKPADFLPAGLPTSVKQSLAEALLTVLQEKKGFGNEKNSGKGPQIDKSYRQNIGYIHITKNDYSALPQHLKKLRTEIEECMCSEELSKCDGRHCLNRTTNYECPPSCGPSCRNRRLANKEHSNVAVTESKLLGRQVIALEHIKKDELIMEFVGSVITSEQSRTEHQYKYETGNFVIDASKKGNEMRFLNHSCRPNAQFIDFEVPGTPGKCPRVAVIACRDIGEEEPITVDYGDKFGLKECLCGEEVCRFRKTERKRRAGELKRDSKKARKY